jgi:hypothetical protein
MALLIFRSRCEDQSVDCGDRRFRYSAYTIPNKIDQPILLKRQTERKTVQESEIEMERDRGNRTASEHPLCGCRVSLRAVRGEFPSGSNRQND